MGNKVLILASVASMVDQFILPNIKLLIDMGFDVDVACNFIEGNNCSDEKVLQLKAQLNRMGVAVYQVDFARNVFNLAMNLRAFRQTYILMKTNRYRFVHCHSPVGGLCGRLAGRIVHTKIIYTAHGFHFYKGAPILNWLIYYPIEKFLSCYTDVLITINREDNENAKKFYAKRVEYIPGVGINTDKIKSITIDRKQKRGELGISEDALLLISVGELNKNKNHVSVIRAISQLENEKVHYVIAGQGCLKQFLTDEVRLLGIDKQVQLLGYRNDIYELCKCADIFIHTSLREGLGLAPLEGMASGLPLISSYVGGIKDYTLNGITGICIADPLNVNEIKTAIDILMNNPKMMINCGNNNKNIAERFNIEISLKATRQIYEEIGEKR